LIEINLLPPEFQKKPKRDFKLPDLPYLRIFGYIALAFVVVEALLFAGTLYGKGNLAQWEQRVKVLGPDFDRIKALKLEASRAEADLKTLNQMTVRSFYWTELLNSVSDSITEDVWLTYLGAERKTIEFDLPKKKDDNDGEEGSDKKEKKNKNAPTPRKRIKRVFVETKGHRIEDYLMIRGSAPVSGQGTAAVGRFIQSLKDNKFVNQLVSDVKLDKIDRINDGTLFTFTVVCRMKTPFGDSIETF